MTASLLPEEAAVAKVLSTCSLAPRESLPGPWTPTEARGVEREGVRLLEPSQCPGARLGFGLKERWHFSSSTCEETYRALKTLQRWQTDKMKSTLGLLKPSALTPKTDGETVTRHPRKVVHFLSTKNKRKLNVKPHRLISNSILSEVNLHFSKKGRKWN